MSILRTLSCTLVLALAGTSCAQAQYYTYDETTKTLTNVANGDPSQQTPEEWQVWLYKYGAPQVGPGWGTLSGKTAAGVMAQYNRLKDGEISFNQHFHLPDGWDILTWTNGLGPIAVFRSKPIVNSAIQSAYDKISDAYEKIEQAMDVYDNALKLAGESDDPEVNNPFGHVGEILKDYGNALEAANERLTELRNKIDDLNNPNLNQITSTLNQINSNLDAESRAFEPTGLALGAYADNEPENNTYVDPSGHLFEEKLSVEGNAVEQEDLTNYFPGTFGGDYWNIVQNNFSMSDVTPKPPLMVNSTTWSIELHCNSDGGGYSPCVSTLYADGPAARLAVGFNGQSGGWISAPYTPMPDSIDPQSTSYSVQDFDPSSKATILFKSKEDALVFIHKYWPNAAAGTPDNQNLTLVKTTDGTKVYENPSGNTADGKIEYSNGASYEGNLSGLTPDGFGLKRNANGIAYLGHFTKGEETGSGELRYPDGSIYIGQLINGVPNGTGAYYSAKGPDLSGLFKNNQLVQPDPPLVTEAPQKFSLPALKVPVFQPLILNGSDLEAIAQAHFEQLAALQILFGETPNQIFNSSYDYTTLPIASEYKTEEIRYLWKYVENDAAWNQYLNPNGCMTTGSYIVWFFKDSSLFRISVRLYADENCTFATAVKLLNALSPGTGIERLEHMEGPWTVFELINSGVANSDGDNWTP